MALGPEEGALGVIGIPAPQLEVGRVEVEEDISMAVLAQAATSALAQRRAAELCCCRDIHDVASQVPLQVVFHQLAQLLGKGRHQGVTQGEVPRMERTAQLLVLPCGQVIPPPIYLPH